MRVVVVSRFVNRTFGALLGMGALVMAGCASNSNAFRLNPEREPEEFRITCKQRFHFCESEARKQCDGEYQVISRRSNRPEQKLAKDSYISSTGPAKGYAGWQGELTVVCGRALPPLKLERPSEPVPDVEAPLEPKPAEAAKPVCVPGVTQACLGPGACSGAQSCLETGLGYGPCDCGTGAAPAVNADERSSETSPAPSSTSSSMPSEAPSTASE
jgi:hypothetical protein